MSVAYATIHDDDAIGFESFRERDAGPAAGRLLGAIAGEVVTLSGPLAAVGSVLNALETPEHGTCDLDVLQTLMPPEPVVYQALLVRLLATDIDGDVLGLIQHFHHRLALVKRATRPVLFRGAPELGGSLDVGALADAWRELVGTALAIVDRIEGLGCLEAGCAARLSWIRGVLEEVGEGGTPCIGDDGCVEIPGIIERRRHKRIAVSWAGWLQGASAMLPITVLNVSRGGAGLVVDGPGGDGWIDVDEHVTLLAKGRRLAGQVAWAAEGHIGIRLVRPLAVDDPLLIEARG